MFSLAARSRALVSADEMRVVARKQAEQDRWKTLPMRWEYTSVAADTWLPIGDQGGIEEMLNRLGADGWEAYAVTPPTPRAGEGDDPDASTYSVLLKRQVPA